MGAGVGEMEGEGDGPGLSMAWVVFPEFGQVLSSFLHFFSMHKRRRGHVNNEITRK